jgi:hypothetical protein
MTFNVYSQGGGGGSGITNIGTATGSLALGTDLTVAGGTLHNTGTLIIPANTITNYYPGIKFQGPAITGPGTATQIASPVGFSGGNATAAAGGHANNGGDAYIASGEATTNVTLSAAGASVYLNGAKINYLGTATGGKIDLNAGSGPVGGAVYIVSGASSGVNNQGAEIYLHSGSGGTNALGGNIILKPGTGGTGNGVVLVPNRTTDPHILGAVWTLSTITGAAAVSQG